MPAALTYLSFDSSACGFSRPRVPALPTLELGALATGTVERRYALVGEGRPQRRYRYARYALHEAYRLAGVGPQAALLAPAYHCRTMLDPAIVLGAPIHLYPLDARLQPGLASLEQAVARSPVPVRALLLTHYFGFAQPHTGAIARWCDERGITLIEDCSHAFFNWRGAEALGCHGRFVTASPYKMFPCELGGLLIAREAGELPATRPGRWVDEARLLLHVFQARQAQRRAPPGELSRLDAELAAIALDSRPRGEHRQGAQPGPSPLYDAAAQGLAPPRVAAAIIAVCDVDRAAERRRARYLQWLDAVRGLPNARALFPQLPDGDVPYVFPLLLDHPDPHFHALKHIGVPIWRWDDIAVSECATSLALRERLIQLPCHQSITDDEMAWLTTVLERVLALAPASGARKG